MFPKLKSYSPPLEPYLEVIHEEPSFIIINKPSGLLSVPGKTHDLMDCVETRAQKLYGKAKAVHRLDMDTSGLLILSLTPKAHRIISKQFENRTIHKTYIAELYGLLENDKGEINIPLLVDWPNRPLQKVDYKDGKEAITYFKVLERRSKTTIVEFVPKTGRSHQLRVHARELGHPIVGDKFYAKGEALNLSKTLRLHAHKLSFSHPESNDNITIECPISF